MDEEGNTTQNFGLLCVPLSIANDLLQRERAPVSTLLHPLKSLFTNITLTLCVLIHASHVFILVLLFLLNVVI